MRVENPSFEPRLRCVECPYADALGGLLDVFVGKGVTCWPCPTPETYQSACLMAEEAAKGGKG